MSDPPQQRQQQKIALRDVARANRLSLTPAQIREKSRRICAHLTGMLDGFDPLMVYVSKPLEVDTHCLLQELLKKRRRIVVPIIEKETKTLRLSYLTDPGHLVSSTFQVMEPIGNERSARPEDVKAVIVPMLAFDDRGHRLGYGAGYYDRFLCNYPHITKIGLAFSCQHTQEVPADANDIGMDFIITEEGILNFYDMDRER
jgi:5-formyltetrahydrofolate cyclo-ligase